MIYSIAKHSCGGIASNVTYCAKYFLSHLHPILTFPQLRNTVEPPNNGHVGDEHFVHCSEVVPSSEVEMYGQLMEGGKQFGFGQEQLKKSPQCSLGQVQFTLLDSRHTKQRQNIMTPNEISSIATTTPIMI